MTTATELKPAHTVHSNAVGIARSLGPAFAARAAEVDDDDAFVADNYRDLRHSGLIEAGVPADLGGGGAEVRELCDMIRELAHHCGSTALAFSMHTHQVAIPAWRWTRQKAAPVMPLLKRVAAERVVLLSSGGSDWIEGSGKAQKVDGGYRITARKIFTSGSPIGDILMTGAVLDEPDGPKVLHFGLPMKSPHVKVLDTWKVMGMRGTGSNDVMIEGHVVPEEAVALKRNQGEWHMLFHIISMIAFPLIYSRLSRRCGKRARYRGRDGEAEGAGRPCDRACRADGDRTQGRTIRPCRHDCRGRARRTFAGHDQRDHDRPLAGRPPRDRRDGTRHGDGGRRSLLPGQGPRTPVPRHSGRPLSSHENRTAAGVFRPHRPRSRYAQDLLRNKSLRWRRHKNQHRLHFYSGMHDQKSKFNAKWRLLKYDNACFGVDEIVILPPNSQGSLNAPHKLLPAFRSTERRVFFLGRGYHLCAWISR
jgi:hypothetical protein